MSDVIEERIIIQNEEVSYRAAVSEASATRMAAVTNLISKRQYDAKAFYVNGKYGLFNSPQISVDGAHTFLFDVEIVGILMFNMTAGISGTTTFDIFKYSTTGGSGSSIFTTKPSLIFSSGNNSFLVSRFGEDPTTLQNPSGSTLPILNSAFLDAGEIIALNIDARQVRAENAGLVIYFRPR